MYLLTAIEMTLVGNNTVHNCIESVHRENNENGMYRTENT